VSERRRFFAVVSDSDLWTCGRCGLVKQVAEFARDATRRTGRKNICADCDRAKSAAYYAANRDAVLARSVARRPPALDPIRVCSECGVLLEGLRRVVCSSRCGAVRFRRTNPAAYAERERRKVEWRRARRREGGS
jgi:ribosomal protein S27AE